MPETARGLHYRVDDVRPPWCAPSAPILFHHGIGTNMGLWAEWVPILASTHPVIRFDMRGFGRSVVPPADHIWSLDELIEDVWNVVDAAGYDAVHMVGESFGATIVLAAAIACPDRVLSLRILNGPFKGNGVGELQSWSDQFASGDSISWSMRMMENRFDPATPQSAALRWFEQEQRKTLPHVALGLGGVLAKTDLSVGLKSLTLPISVVFPDGSPFVSVDHGNEMMKLVRHGTFRVVRGARHGLPFTHARQEAAALLSTLHGNL